MDQTAYVPVNQNPPPYTPEAYPKNVINNPMAPTVAPEHHTVVIVTQPDPYMHSGNGPAIGRCPKCQIGVVRLNFTLLGFLWALFCFPCGLFCLFSLRDKRCSHCGYDMNHIH